MTARLTMPQRIAPQAPIGSLFKARAHKATVSLARGRVTDAEHLALIRELPCLKCGVEPCGEAAHVRMNSAAFGKRQAIGKKPGDEWTVPLCRACHQGDADSQHKVGEALFWDRLGLNPLIVAKELHRVSGDLLAMRTVALLAITERTR